MLPRTHVTEIDQFARLTGLLRRWGALPLYRGHWGRDLAATAPTLARRRFAQLPCITKQHLRDGFPANFLGSSDRLTTLLAAGRVELEHTSGSTGERTPVLLGVGWWEAQEARALRLNRRVAGLLDEPGPARRCVLTTPACNGNACPSIWRPADRRTEGASLAVNQARIPFLLHPRELDRMVEEVLAWQPRFLDVDPVHGMWFALHCERRGVRLPSLRFVISSYEVLSHVHRRIMERVFQAPVFNLYGSTETGHLLMEDEAGGLLPCLENAFLEVPETDAGGIGELVVTTLSNDYMPLLRYRIGDLVSRRRVADGWRYRVHGRARDCLQDATGQRVTSAQIDDCFAGIEGIAHYEAGRFSDGTIRLRYVPDGDGPEAASLRELLSRLQARLRSSAPPRVQRVPWLPPAPSGKFRLTRALEPGTSGALAADAA